MEEKDHSHHAEGLPMRVMMALGNIEQTLHAMNERLSKLETKMNSAMNHDHRRSIRFGQHVSLGPSRSHRVPVSPSVRRDSNLLTPEDMLNDSMVMVRLEADELSPRNHPSVSGQLGPKIGSGNGSGRNLPKTSIKTSSSYSPKSAEVTTPQALLEPEGSIAAVSLPISDIGSSMKSNGKHVSSSSIQSFHELVAMTRVKRQLKTKNRMPAVDEHSTLDHPSISPSFAATSLHQSSGANDEGLESSMSTFSAPQAQQLSLTRAQSFQQESELDDEAMIQNATLPRSSLVTKSVNWLQQKLPHLSTSNSHTQSQLSGQIPSEIRNLRAAAKHSAYDIRLQMFNVQIRRAASGVEKLAILTWWQYPWIVFKWIFWDMLDPTRHGTREVRIVWDFVMIMAMLYILFATPLIIGFNINTLGVSTNPFAAFDLFINCVLMTDVWVQFRTPYTAPDLTQVTDRYLVAKRYVLSGWLFIDIPSSLPWDNMLQNSNLTIIKVLRLVRISHTFYRFRTLKLRNMRGFQEQNVIFIVESVLGTTILSLLKLLSLAILILHWAACLFYYSSSWNNFSSITWVYRQGLVPGTWNGNTVNSTASLDVRYLYSLYFTTVTMATVGYGDVVPIASVEKVIDLFMIFIGITLFGLLMGLMAQAVNNSSVREARIAKRRQLVQEFIEERHLPKDIADQVVRFYLFRATKEIAIEEKEIISGLPKSLRDLVIEHLYIDLVVKFEFFEKTLAKHPAFLSSVIQHLKRELYIPGDDIVRQGEIGRSMYFISEGKCEIRVWTADHPADVPGPHMRVTHKESEAELEEKLARRWGPLIEEGCYLEEGSSFGCYSCLLEEPRAATVLATLYSEIFCLTRIDLEKIIEDWPGLADDFETFIEHAETRTEFDV